MTKNDPVQTFTRSAELVDTSRAAEGIVTVRVVPWDDPRMVQDRRATYEESFARGGLIPPTPPADAVAEREHDGPIVGVAVEYHDRDDGLYADVRMSRSSVGADMLADLDAGIYRYVSADFYDAPVPAGATRVRRTGARLKALAFTRTPQHDAPVVSIRSTPPAPEEADPTMTTTDQQNTDPDTGANDPPAPPAPTPAAPAATGEQHQRSGPDTRPSVPRPAAPSQNVTPSRFESFGHFARAAADGTIEADDVRRYRRALADVITGDVDGLIREQWINEVIDLVRTYTPTLNNWRRRPLPAKGMSVHQPIVTTRPTVGLQSTQKTEITSTDVEYGEVNWPIRTFAGGNDISLQTIQRTEPDFLNELMRLYTREMAQGMNAAVATALNTAAAVGVSGNAALEYDPAFTPGTDPGFDAVVIAASSQFMKADSFRRPAEVMALSVDLWANLAGLTDLDGRPLYPSVNPMNAHGTMSAATPSGDLLKIAWYVEPDLGDGIKGVIGVREAFVAALGGVNTLAVDVPSKIGRDVAVWQEIAYGAADASGLIQIEDSTEE